MFEATWSYHTFCAWPEAADWYAAKVAHQLCEAIPRKLAPTREEEEERRREFARRMAETLFVAGMLSASPQGAAGGAVARSPTPDARSPTPHWDAETDTFSFPN